MLRFSIFIFIFFTVSFTLKSAVKNVAFESINEDTIIRLTRSISGMIFSLHRVKADKFELIMSMREMLHEKCQEF